MRPSRPTGPRNRFLRHVLTGATVGFVAVLVVVVAAALVAAVFVAVIGAVFGSLGGAIYGAFRLLAGAGRR
ncbi:MAG: hypothetical protein WD208_06500 [Dehalococcoidia bacterium]